MRSLILSDIHGNLEALEAALASAPQHDAVWNLGDVVGYGASPNEVIAHMRTLATHNVRGNHDKVCCGITSVNNFNRVARDAAVWTAAQLTPESSVWLRTLPIGPLPAGNGVALSHGSPIDEDQYILTVRDAWVPLQHMQQRLTFFGHTHIQGGFGWDAGRWFEIAPQMRRSDDAAEWTLKLEDGRRYLLNPGSVGQPRDGDWRAAYALYDDVAKTIAYHRVPYDLSRSQGRILMANLPERLAVRLREGR